MPPGRKLLNHVHLLANVFHQPAPPTQQAHAGRWSAGALANVLQAGEGRRTFLEQSDANADEAEPELAQLAELPAPDQHWGERIGIPGEVALDHFGDDKRAEADA